MKLIEAIINGSTIDEVKVARQEMGIGKIGLEEILVSQLSGNNQKNKKPLFYRGTEYVADFMTKLKVEIIVADNLVDKVIATIRKIAGMEKKEAGRIYILSVIEAV